MDTAPHFSPQVTLDDTRISPRSPLELKNAVQVLQGTGLNRRSAREQVFRPKMRSPLTHSTKAR